jgi:hypothetical protein
MNHAGVEYVLAKIRSKYWIPGARRFLKLVAWQCVVCRKKKKAIHSQIMGSLPEERLKPSPTFYFSAVDFFEHFTIRDSVKKRTHGKAYGVIFTCLMCRGVYRDLTESYSTDNFMLTLRRFASIRGYPRKMRSDAGTQLIGASKEISDINVNMEWDKIRSLGENCGMEWKIGKSANAPWENGCCEALIKSNKVSLSSTIGSSVMTFAELETVIFEVANYINERPIGLKNNDPNEGSYLCPNDLLLGRASSSVPPGSWSAKECFKLRWKFVQQVVDSFWNRWIRDYFPTLIIRPKWQSSTKNLKVGDIVMVQDSNLVRGQRKRVQVHEANLGKDGKVRGVQIRYKALETNNTYHGCDDTRIRRSVNRLVVFLPVEEHE